MRTNPYLYVCAIGTIVYLTSQRQVASFRGEAARFFFSHSTKNAYLSSKSREVSESYLGMGGYYADPDVPVDQSQTHMIFGIRCIETITPIAMTPTPGGTTQDDKGNFVVSLQPVAEDDKVVHEYGPTVLQFLNEQEIDWKDKHFVEVGASSTGLALCHLLLDTVRFSATVCHPDEQRLRILEHAEQFFNAPAKHSLQRHILKQDIPLPQGNFFVFTVSEELNRIKEVLAMPGPPRIFVPTILISAAQLEQYEYQEDTVHGVIEILHVATEK